MIGDEGVDGDKYDVVSLALIWADTLSLLSTSLFTTLCTFRNGEWLWTVQTFDLVDV